MYSAAPPLPAIGDASPPCIFDSSLIVIEHGPRGWQTDAPLVWEDRQKAWVASSSLGRARTVAWASKARILQGRASKEVAIGIGRALRGNRRLQRPTGCRHASLRR